MTEYECIGGPMDGERLKMLTDDATDYLIEMNGWAYILEDSQFVWQRLKK